MQSIVSEGGIWLFKTLFVRHHAKYNMIYLWCVQVTLISPFNNRLLKVIVRESMRSSELYSICIRMKGEGRVTRLGWDCEIGQM